MNDVEKVRHCVNALHLIAEILDQIKETVDAIEKGVRAQERLQKKRGAKN